MLLFKNILMVQSLLFIGAGAGAGEIKIPGAGACQKRTGSATLLLVEGSLCKTVKNIAGKTYEILFFRVVNLDPVGPGFFPGSGSVSGIICFGSGSRQKTNPKTRFIIKIVFLL